jgi:hypothetical protein
MKLGRAWSCSWRAALLLVLAIALVMAASGIALIPTDGIGANVLIALASAAVALVTLRIWRSARPSPPPAHPVLRWLSLSLGVAGLVGAAALTTTVIHPSDPIFIAPGTNCGTAFGALPVSPSGQPGLFGDLFGDECEGARDDRAFFGIFAGALGLVLVVVALRGGSSAGPARRRFWTQPLAVGAGIAITTTCLGGVLGAVAVASSRAPDAEAFEVADGICDAIGTFGRGVGDAVGREGPRMDEANPLAERKEAILALISDALRLDEAAIAQLQLVEERTTNSGYRRVVRQVREAQATSIGPLVEASRLANELPTDDKPAFEALRTTISEKVASAESGVTLDPTGIMSLSNPDALRLGVAMTRASACEGITS